MYSDLSLRDLNVTLLMSAQAYFTILGHHPTLTSFARASAQQTLTTILQLHDELLGELYRVVPFAEYDQHLAKASAPSTANPRPAHVRWHSVDVVTGQTQPYASPNRVSLAAAIHQRRRSLQLSRSSEQDAVVLRCAPQVVAAVVEVFRKYVRACRFISPDMVPHFLAALLTCALLRTCRSPVSKSTLTTVRTTRW